MQDLEFNAGKDPLHDRYITGRLSAINEILNMKAEDITTVEDQEDDS